MRIVRAVFPIILATFIVTSLGAQEREGLSSQAPFMHRLDADNVKGSLIGIQYENFFTEGASSWQTAEAVPILGKYSSYDASILKKHFDWFHQLGINWLLIDWSNMLWSTPAWEKHWSDPRVGAKCGAHVPDFVRARKRGKIYA